MKNITNEKGFTLLEMMVVLLIISILILIAIPNVTKHSKSIDEKGCNAYVKMKIYKSNYYISVVKTRVLRLPLNKLISFANKSALFEIKIRSYIFSNWVAVQDEPLP